LKFEVSSLSKAFFTARIKSGTVLFSNNFTSDSVHDVFLWYPQQMYILLNAKKTADSTGSSSISLDNKHNNIRMVLGYSWAFLMAPSKKDPRVLPKPSNLILLNRRAWINE
jgi:hypothetical protein